MYKPFLTFITTLLLCAFVSLSSANDIVLWGNYKKAPKIYFNNQHQAEGILINIANLISQRTDLNFQYYLAPWARAYQEALYPEDNSTGIIGIKKNQERIKEFDFSVPLYHDTNYLVVLKDRKFKLQSIKELKGLTVAYNRNGYFGEKFEEAKKYFIDAADTNILLRLKKLLRGRIDAALIGGPGELGLEMAFAQSPELKMHQDKFVLLPIEFSTTDHIAFSKKLQKQDVLDKINSIIRELQKEGAIQEIINHYNH